MKLTECPIKFSKAGRDGKLRKQKIIYQNENKIGKLI